MIRLLCGSRALATKAVRFRLGRLDPVQAHAEAGQAVGEGVGDAEVHGAAPAEEEAKRRKPSRNLPKLGEALVWMFMKGVILSAHSCLIWPGSGQPAFLMALLKWTQVSRQFFS